jgi:hypothetical protein
LIFEQTTISLLISTSQHTKQDILKQIAPYSYPLIILPIRTLDGASAVTTVTILPSSRHHVILRKAAGFAISYSALSSDRITPYYDNKEESDAILLLLLLLFARQIKRT